MRKRKVSNSSNDKLNMSVYVVLAFAFLMLILLAKVLLRDDCSVFFTWWVVLALLGCAFMPLSSRLMDGFADKGWIFSKCIGLALAGWLMWFLSSFKLLRFTQVNCFLCIFIFLIGFITVPILKNKIKGIKQKKHETVYNANTIVLIILSELVFMTLLIFWLYMKGYNPSVYGTTEKLMDFGFMQSIMKSEYMPPEDLWLSGTPINYYYLGQYLATYMTKLCGLEVGYGYNLMLMTLAALGFSCPCSLVYNLAASKNHYKTDETRTVKDELFPYVAGVLSGLAVAYSGSLHYVLYRYLIPDLRDLLGITEMSNSLGYQFKDYWFPNSTRYIGYYPETADKTIHEFPMYSYVLGDLHAHVINTIFVFCVLAILLGYLLKRKSTMDEAMLTGKGLELSNAPDACFGIKNFAREIFSINVIMIGFFIGLFHMTNYWDFPIYFVVAGAIILFSNAKIYGFSVRSLILTAFHAIVVLVISTFVCLPFKLNFVQISNSLRLCTYRSPLYQLIVLWGLPVCCVAIFFFTKLKEFNNSTKVRKGLFGLLNSLSANDLFIWTIGLCAIGLVLIPEFVYVTDIYTTSFQRANTVFKLTYQAFILFGISMGYIIPDLIFHTENKSLKRWSIVLMCLLLWTTGYFGNSTLSWFGDYLSGSGYKGINCDGYLKDLNEQDYYATEWIKNNIEDRPVMLEAYGLSYTYGNRVSANTGLPTILGWRTHEWLWQSNGSPEYPEILLKRAYDVETIYTSHDINEVRRLINEYDVDYIYVGDFEKESFEAGINHKLLLQLGTVVYPETFNENYCDKTTYIIKLDKE